MPAPISTTWSIEPHTKAKHDILRRYLGAWFPILNRWNGRIIYIDGFAGPGEYTGGEPGSPIIAIEVAAYHRRQLSGEVKFLFIEEDKARKDHLQAILNSRIVPSNFRIEAKCAEFHVVLDTILNDLKSQKLQIAPTFAFIDPFGFSGVPMRLVHRLLKYPRTETFITFMVGSINRFLEHPNPQTNAHMVDLFGTEEVLEISTSKGDRIENLRSLYQRQLKQAATYVRYFHMRDRRNVPIYDLFFAGNHELGHYRMKEAMWRVDPEGEFSFSDATNPAQPTLFSLDHTQSFLDSIRHKFTNRVNLPVSQVKQWVRNETPFLDNHMKDALTRGEQKGVIVVNPTKQGGSRRRRGTFPDDALISFL